MQPKAWRLDPLTSREFSRKPIDKSVLVNAIKTAGSAPSGANRQPWCFVLITSQDIKDQIRRAAEAVESHFYEKRATAQWLADLESLGTNATKPYLSEAPALIAVFSRTACESGIPYHFFSKYLVFLAADYLRVTVKKNSQKPESDIHQKLKIAEDLFNLAYSVKSHQLKLKHPEWPKEMIHQHTLELIDRGCA